MRNCLLTFAAVAAIMAGSGVAFAQSVAAGDYKPPRTTWGVPQLDGVWTNASLTSLQKSSAASAVTVTEAERAAGTEMTKAARVRAQRAASAGGYEAEAEGVTSEDVIKTLLDKIPVP